jgi:hypothetical protein
MTRFENIGVFIREKVWLEPILSRIKIPQHSSYLPAYEDGTECSETSKKFSRRGITQKKSIQRSEHGESLKSRIHGSCFTVTHGFRNLVTRVSWAAWNGTGGGQHRQGLLFLDEVWVELCLRFVTWCSDSTQKRTFSQLYAVIMFRSSSVYVECCTECCNKSGLKSCRPAALHEHLGHCFQLIILTASPNMPRGRDTAIHEYRHISVGVLSWMFDIVAGIELFYAGPFI